MTSVLTLLPDAVLLLRIEPGGVVDLTGIGTNPAPAEVLIGNGGQWLVLKKGGLSQGLAAAILGQPLVVRVTGVAPEHTASYPMLAHLG